MSVPDSLFVCLSIVSWYQNYDDAAVIEHKLEATSEIRQKPSLLSDTVREEYNYFSELISNHYDTYRCYFCDL